MLGRLGWHTTREPTSERRPVGTTTGERPRPAAGTLSWLDESHAAIVLGAFSDYSGGGLSQTRRHAEQRAVAGVLEDLNISLRFQSGSWRSEQSALAADTGISGVGDRR